MHGSARTCRRLPRRANSGQLGARKDSESVKGLLTVPPRRPLQVAPNPTRLRVRLPGGSTDSLTARARVQEGPGPEIEMGLRLGESHVGTDHPYRASADSDAAGAARPLNWAIVTLGDCHG